MYKKAKAKDYIFAGITSLITFIIFFSGSDYIAQNSHYQYRLYWQWELNIPYIPSFFIIYYGIFFLPFLIPLYIKNKYELHLLTFKICVSIIIASIFFILYPCTLGYKPIELNNDFFFHLNKVIAGYHNLIPSLHVCLSVIIFNSLFKYLCNRLKLFFIFIELLLIASTLFTHQHHISDIFGGLVLALVIVILAKTLIHEYSIRSK